MILDANFKEINHVLQSNFGTVYSVVYDRYGEGYEDGQKAEYDRFWDAFQYNGTRTYYNNAFPQGWNDVTFQPKYDFKVTEGQQMFQYSSIEDLAGILRNRGITLDLSNATNIYMMFYWAKSLKTIPSVDTRKSTRTDLYYLFGSSPKIESIEKVILKDDGSQTFNGTFAQDNALKEVRFEGVIGNNISFAESSFLSNESVQSIIDHLKDLTGATAKTLTFYATVGGKLTAEQKATITAKNWTLVY